MRIVYFVPGPMARHKGEQELEQRRGILQGFAASGTEVCVWDTPEGPASIESTTDESLAIPRLLENVAKAEGANCDALIVGCFGDPGVEAAREVATIPIIGPCEASLLASVPLGHRTSIITVLHNMVYPLRRVVRLVGLEARLASILSVEISVLDLASHRPRLMEAFVEAGKKAIREDEADVLIPGCMGMAFLGIAEEAQPKLGVPVLNPAAVALKTAELYVRLGLRHSKQAYPFPPKGTYARRA